MGEQGSVEVEQTMVIRPKRKRKSAVWLHFEETPQGNSCQVCGRLFQLKTSTSSLRYHIKHEHNMNVFNNNNNNNETAMTSIPSTNSSELLLKQQVEQQQQQQQQYLQLQFFRLQQEEQQQLLEESQQLQDEQQLQNQQHELLQQQELEQHQLLQAQQQQQHQQTMYQHQFEPEKADHLLCQFVVANKLSSRIVDNESFRQFFAFLCPHYKPPNREKLKTILIPQMKLQPTSPQTSDD